MSNKYTKSDIENRLRVAVSHAVPDVREKIIDRCEKLDDFSMVRKHRKKKKIAYWQKIVAAAAILLVVMNLLFVLSFKRPSEKIAAVIDIDVNPSIELTINSDDKVIKALPNNEDAVAVLDGMDLVGTQTKVAINAIMGSMLEHGYLKDNTNYVLVSVESRTNEASEKIEEKVTGDIDAILSNYSVEATVIAQTTETEAAVVQLADDYGISQGKATLIKHIMALDSSYYEDELSIMSIAELDSLLLELEQRLTVNTESTGNNSENDNQTPDVKDSVSENSISDNSADSTVSENSVSENSISDNKIDETDVSENSISKNSVSRNSVSSNDIINEED